MHDTVSPHKAARSSILPEAVIDKAVLNTNSHWKLPQLWKHSLITE